jgi:hypothetical protein
VVSVSALGLVGWGPPDSLSATRLPQAPDQFGHDNLYLANFSYRGATVDCAAPGVGIISTVPDPAGVSALHGVMDGTSMASPITCGALANLLGQSPAYLALPRDVTRANAARAILQTHLRSIGLRPIYEGGGMMHL